MTSDVDVVQLERELTAWFAEVLGLVVDSGIYRGAVPDAAESGVAVRVTDVATPAGIDTPSFVVQVLGRFASRDEAWAMLRALSGALPVYGRETAGFRLVCLRPEDAHATPYTAAERGAVRHYASFNVRAFVLPRGA